MYKRLNDDIPRDGWDALMIGSGPGSLSCAAALARAGQRVLVLEKHYEPGGFSHTFKRKSFEWDVGVHYIGAVHREWSVERKTFDYVSNEKLKWAFMDSPYDRAEVEGKFYDFIPNEKEQIELWVSYFPEEEEAIRKYWAMVRECASSSGKFFAEKVLPPFLSKTIGRFMTSTFRKYSDRTTYEVLRELTDNETLITVLCAQCGDYGLPPKDSSFAIHAMLVNHYRSGANYPIGGAAQIGETIIDTIEAHNGSVVLRCGVESLLIENKRAVGVRLESGEEILAKRVISGIGARNTYAHLLPQEALNGFNPTNDLKTVPPSTGHMCLYVGLNKSDAELNLPKYNYWCYDPYTGDGTPGSRMPTVYISFPSAKDPSWSETHPGTATIQCIGLCNFDEVEQWADTRWKKRGDDYEALKEAFKEKMCETLFRLHPECEEHVAWAEVSSPLSTVHFSFYDQGEIYGLSHTPERFKLDWLRPRTHIKDFYLTGQDICSAGVVPALVSGLMTASSILKTNPIKDIMKGDAP